MKIIKRNGSEAVFDRSKIAAAVDKANHATDQTPELSPQQVEQIALNVENAASKVARALSVEEIQELVETELMRHSAYETAKRYIRYRYTRSLARAANTTDNQILTLIECNNEEVKQENSNKNPTVNSVQRDYMAGEVSKDITQRLLLPPDIVEAHKEGIIHFHDMDYYAQHMHNCDLVNLEDMLQNGTVISGTLIEKPHSFSTACNIATQIIAQVASNQYGGQSISLAHLAPFVQISRDKIRQEVLTEAVEMGGNPSGETISKIVEKRLREEIRRGVQTIQYQVVTLMTTNGQAPFVTVFMYLGEVKDPQTKRDLALIIEETLNQRYQGVKNEAGVWITPAFPKLIYVLEEDNVRPGTPYYYLTELAAKCTAKRMVPDYISEKIMLQNKVDKNGEGHCYTCMGCRSFLTPYVDPETNQPKYYGRFNQGVVTLNLVDIALSSGGDMDKFWSIFDERLDLCYRALMCRHNRLKGTLSDAAPILWQYGALARLKKGEPIDKLLYNGYSTISLGYAGLYECVKYMTGRSHTDPAATVDEYGLRLLNLLSLHGASPEQIEGGILGSVVPALTGRVLAALQMLCPVRILTVGPGLKSGIRLRLDNPAQLGAELLCGAVAALAEGSGPLVVISADTAISLMAVNGKQELVGGVILPGPQLSLAALVQNTAQLPQIDLSAPAPASVLGKNTAACLQNGFVLGTAGMLDGLADHFCAELGPETKFYATGNLPTAIRDACRTPILYRETLITDGLYCIWLRNRR